MNPTNPIPDRYTRPLITSQGNEVWGVYTKANEPEQTHQHNGGVLFALAQKITVHFPVTHRQMTQGRVGTELEDIPLAKSEPHYAVTPQDYKAVFIELKTRSAPDTARAVWTKPPQKCEKSSFGSEALNITLVSDAELWTGPREAFLVGKSAIKVSSYADKHFSSVKELAGLPHYVYYLKPGQRYQLAVSVPTKMFLLEA